jgi:hypothetical protein
MYNVIGDIAGRYKTFLALIEKMPKGQTISVGDLMDRGPRSKEVIQWFMDHPEAICLYGNHEDLMVDAVAESNSRYAYGTWEWNGGEATLLSYANQIPPEHIAFLRTRKLHLELKIDDLTYWVSHAFPTKKWMDTGEEDFEEKIWNRDKPVRSFKFTFQIAGHNSQYGLKEFKDEHGPIGICIDTSASKILTGIHLPTRQIFQQEYID